MPNAIDSTAARTRWARVVPRVMPVMVPRASGSQCGVPKPDERRHESDAAGVADAHGERLRLGRRRDDAEAVAQPLDRRAGDEHAALERVGRLARGPHAAVASRPGAGQAPHAPACTSRNAPVP